MRVREQDKLLAELKEIRCVDDVLREDLLSRVSNESENNSKSDDDEVTISCVLQGIITAQCSHVVSKSYVAELTNSLGSWTKKASKFG